MWRWVARVLVVAAFISLTVAPVYAQGFVGNLDKPAPNQTVSGMVLVQGFALASSDISSIELYVDDEFQHSANINLPRIDVIQAYPDWEGIQLVNPGFSTGFSANRFRDGTHTVHVLVTTSDGVTTEVGRRGIVIDNTINQAPFGSIDIPSTGAIHDASGSFPVVGWTSDTDGVDRIDILVDGLVMQSAIYGDPRPDVAVAFPDFPAAMFSGFIAHMDSTRVLNGVHELLVRVTDNEGLSRTIGRRDIQIFNSENNLRPFGWLDEPLRDDVLYGTACDDIPTGGNFSPLPGPGTRPASVLTPIRGWALDLGTREDPGRVAYVEVMVDGVQWVSTNDCTFVDSFGGYVNCYGMQRFDVQKYYPTYPDAPRAGFMFGLDVGAMLAIGVSPGHHDLKIRVGDKEQTFADIPNTGGIPVFFECADTLDNFASLGYIDFPLSMDYINGTVVFRGWALDSRDGGVQSVQVWVDGIYVGNAVHGLKRPDVQAAYPMMSNSLNSGWRFEFDTTQLANARHRMTVVVIDGEGASSTIGSVDFFTANSQ